MKQFLGCVLSLCSIVQAMHTPLYDFCSYPHVWWQVDDLRTSNFGLKCFIEPYMARASRVYDQCGAIQKKCSFPFLVFGKESWYGQETFENARTNSPQQIWLAHALLSPRAYVHEHGCDFLAHASYNYDESPYTWYVNGEFPYRCIKSYLAPPQRPFSDSGSSIYGGIRSSDVLAIGPDGNTFALRFDVVRDLPVDAHNSVGLTQPFVVYADPSFPSDPITLSNCDCTNQANSPVSIEKAPPGVWRQAPDGIVQALVDTEPFVDATATNLGVEIPARFNINTNYTPLGTISSRDAASLWIKPTQDNTGIMVDAARIIRDHIRDLLDEYTLSAEDFFASKGVWLGNTCRRGCGDITLTLGLDRDLGCHGKGGLFVSGIYGHAKPRNPCRVLDISTGADGNSRIGAGGHIDLYNETIAGGFEARINHACAKTRPMAALFDGALVRGLGPAIPVQVWWNEGAYTLYGTLTRCGIKGMVYLQGQVWGEGHGCTPCRYAYDFLGHKALLASADAPLVSQKRHVERGGVVLSYQGYNGECAVGARVVLGGRSVLAAHEFYGSFALGW